MTTLIIKLKAAPLITTESSGVTVRHLAVERIEFADGEKMTMQEMIARRFLECKPFKKLALTQRGDREFVLEVEK